MSRASVRTLVEDLVREPPIAEHTVWGSGVQRSELSRAAQRLLKSEWKQLGHRAWASIDAPLSRTQHAGVAELLRDLRPTVVLLAATSADLIARVRHLCAASDPRWLGLDSVSGRCSSAAASHLRRHGRPPTPTELHEMALSVLDAASAAPSLLPAAEFSALYAGMFEDRWRAQGGPNLSMFPPSALLLGRDRQPPLVRPRHAPRETDADGTDRSVYSRYVSYRPPGTTHAVTFRSRATHCIQPVTRRPRERGVAAEEVLRACLPYGLVHQSHRCVLRATHHGIDLDLDATGSTGAGASLRTSCVTLGCADTDDISETVRQLLAYRLAESRRSAAAPAGILDVEALHWSVEGYQLPVTSAHMDRITRVIMCRLWKALHGLELYVEEHMCSCSLIKAVSVAVDRAVPAALHQSYPTRNTDSDPDGDSPAQAASSVTRLIEAQNRTCDLLAHHTDLARRLLLLQPGWGTAYADLVAHHPEQYLSPAEFAEWCREVVPGSATDHPGRGLE